jgi:hypothetical protein
MLEGMLEEELLEKAAGSSKRTLPEDLDLVFEMFRELRDFVVFILLFFLFFSLELVASSCRINLL